MVMASGRIRGKRGARVLRGHGLFFAPILVGVVTAFLPACGAGEPTQVDIRVTPGANLAAVTAFVSVESRGGDVDGDGGEVLDSHRYGEAAPLTWPLHIAVAPADGDAARELYIVVELRDAVGNAITSAIVQGEFSPARRTEVTLDLPDCCIGTSLCSRATVRAGGGDVAPEAFCTPDARGVPDGEVPDEAPALVAPENGASTGSVHAPASLVPRFSWDPVPSASRYELELSDRCSVAAYPDCTFTGARVEGTTALHLTPTTPLPVSTTAPVGTRWVWRVRGCAEGGCGPWSRVRYLDVGRLANDIDGDGYSDLVAGAPTRADGGAVYLFSGGSGGPDLAPSAWSETAAGAAAELGYDVAVGDLDGDGRAEIVAGAPGGDGRVLIFSGPVGRGLGLAAELFAPAPGQRFGASVGIADLDGDGFRDVIVGAPGLGGAAGVPGVAYVYTGGAIGSVEPSRIIAAPGSALSFGARVTALGDADGDGLEDVLITAPGGPMAVAYLFLGNDAGMGDDSPRMLSSGSGRPDDSYGAAAAPVGDIDGDGRPDFAIGADTMGGAGAVLLYTKPGVEDRFGSPGHVIRGGGAGERFGTALATVGDLDGDGLAEVIAGARDAASGGAVRVISSMDPSILGATELSPSPSQPGAAFGACVASAGDLDGDGMDDLVVAAPGWDSDSGRLFIYPGGARGLGEAMEVAAPAGGAGGAFGRLPPVR